LASKTGYYEGCLAENFAPQFPVIQSKGTIAVFTFRHAVVTLSLTLFAGPAQADGLLYQLPKDGAWAQFEFNGSSQVER
jgi:hypothetical protein